MSIIKIGTPDQMAAWLAQMAATDVGMPRSLEDTIDALPAPSRAAIAQATLDRYNAKKTLRAAKPEAECA